MEQVPGAFKVFAHVCLHAPRASGELAFRQAQLAHSLGKSRSALARHLTELADKGVCTIRHAPNQHRRCRLRVRTHFWSYRREASSAAPVPCATAAYIDSVRQAFLKPACVQAAFGPDDRRLAAQWHRDSIPIETVRRAIHLGCVRKSAAMIDNPQSQPIRSLRYFRRVLQEVREVSVSDSFWDYVEVSLERFERRLPDLKS
ncbi:MAG: hypothetical protein OXN89_08070 [Bryobacterales bacterium]|nr:hypothetical protein [Bryobacterales bacterium]